MTDRTPKRHTSMAVLPMGTPILPTIQLTQDNTPLQSPPSNTQIQQPLFTFGRDLGFLRNRSSAPDLTNSGNFQHTARGESVFLDQSTTAVGSSTWDNILVDSPIGSLAPLNQPLGDNQTLKTAGQWPTTMNRTNNSYQKHSHNKPNALDLLNAQTPRQAPRDKIYGDMKTENNIMTNSTRLQRTAKPNRGWPKIHLDIHPFENVITLQVESWKCVSTFKVWIKLFRSKYESNSLVTIDRTRALLKSLVCVDSDVALGVSFPLQDHAMESDRFPPPYHMMVLGLTEKQKEHLVDLKIVLTKDITVIFKPFENSRPTFVMTIYGLTFVNSEEARSTVTSLIVHGIQGSEQVIKHIVKCAPIQSNQVANNILNNISIKFLEMKRSKANGGDFRRWNVFLHHSYLSDDNHVKLIQLMRMCTFLLVTAGFGLPLLGKDTLLCISCKSINHDTPNCPFPDLPGWFGL